MTPKAFLCESDRGNAQITHARKEKAKRDRENRQGRYEYQEYNEIADYFGLKVKVICRLGSVWDPAHRTLLQPGRQTILASKGLLGTAAPAPLT
jgi:hypothetical protein